MKLKPYEKYKPSGIDRIEQVPEDWKVRRVKDTVKKIGNGVTPLGGSSVYSDAGVPFLRSQNVYDNGLRINNVSFISDTIHNSMRNSSLKKYDILINITGASIGRTYLVPESLEKANINQHIAFLRINTNNHFFISVFLKSQLIKDYIFSEQLGASKEAFNLSQIANIPLILPNDILQTKIANFLDQKTSQTDKKINLLEQKLRKYEELKKTLINETVCRGLNKNVELKESCIEWIGKIPKHWEVRRLKEYVKFSKGVNAGKYTNEFVKDITNYGLFPVYSGQTGNACIMATINSFEYNISNNVIFVTTVGAKAMTIKIVSGKFSLSQNCALISLKDKRSFIDYYYYYLTQLFNDEKKLIPSHMQPSLRIEDLRTYKIIIPPLSEQTQIANYLDNKCNKIDKIRATIKKEILILKEFRKTLINDVVTGKVRIN